MTGKRTPSRVSIKTGLKALGVLRGKIADKVPAPTPTVAKPKKPRQSRLTDDEQDVWDHVADSVAPVRVKARVPVNEVTAAAVSSEPVPPRRAGKAKSAAEPVAPALFAPVAPPHAKAPPRADFDARKAKRICRGQVEIEARIDLHGDRLAEAHDRLRGFLFSCHANGRRTVLVITGKGRATDGADDAYDIGYERRERGVLRRHVPLWLAEPDLRAIVVGYTEAHVRHGGAGALYVQLRRAK